MALLALFVISPLLSQRADDLLSADHPIAYGEAAFRSRILERTGSERSPVGLVLSGGSARAFAHIGVLRYLEEQGIIPDFIISNSMGSIVGLLYSAGLSPDQIYSAVTGVSIQSLFDLGFPIRGGLLDSSRFLSNLASVLGPSLDLADLAIPIIVVTEDLVTKRQVLLSEGDFYTVLKASYALPVYFDPVEFRGHLLIDGGITNLVPVDLAFEYADSVIVSTTFYDIDTLDLRNPLTILNVSLDIGKRRQGVEELKEHLDEAIWIRNNVEDVSFMEFSKVDHLVLQGYESAKEQREKLAALPAGERWASLSELRSSLQVKLSKSQDRYKLFDHVTMHRPAHLVGPSLAQEGERHLIDDFNLGLGYSYALENLDVHTSLGGTISLANSAAFSIMPALMARADYHLFSHLRTSLYSSVLYDLSSGLPILSLGAAAEGRLLSWNDQVRLSLSQTFEHLSLFDAGSRYQSWGGHTYLATSKVEAHLALKQQSIWRLPEAQADLSYLLLGDWSDSRSFLAFSLAGKVAYAPLGLWAAVTGWGRFALDAKGDVPLFGSDGFRTADGALRSQGHDLSLATNGANHLVGVKSSIGWQPVDFSPSLGEVLIFKNSSLRLYTDLLFSENAFRAKVSVGLELYTEISLLGISTLPTTIYGGWDQASGGIVWGLGFTLAL